MNSNFEYYKVFYFVSKYQNLTRAANALRTSQPAVTRTIHNLENEMGCRLFIRAKNGMTHTPEGEALFRYVSEGCAQFFKGENIVSTMTGPENGNVYISATETALHCYLFEAMSEFKIKHPNIHFKILNNSSSDSIKVLKEGHVDMAVVSAPLQIEHPLRKLFLKEYQDILIGGMVYVGLQNRKVSLSEMTGCPWISLTAGSFTRKFIEEYFEGYDLSFEPDIEVDTTDMILTAAKHNMGIGFIPPEFAQDAINRGELLQIKTEEPFPTREITLVYDAEAPHSAASKVFRTFLKKRMEVTQQRENGFRIY